MTASSSSHQFTSPAVVSELPLVTIRDIVATLQAAFPAEHARISRGVEVLLASKIVEMGTTGRYLVQSTADGLLAARPALEPGQVGGGDAGTPAPDRPLPRWRRWGWWH